MQQKLEQNSDFRNKINNNVITNKEAKQRETVHKFD